MQDLSVVSLKTYSKWMRGITSYCEITLLSIYRMCWASPLCRPKKKGRIKTVLLLLMSGLIWEYNLEALRACALLNKANIVHITWLISQTGKSFGWKKSFSALLLFSFPCLTSPVVFLNGIMMCIWNGTENGQTVHSIAEEKYWAKRSLQL